MRITIKMQFSDASTSKSKEQNFHATLSIKVMHMVLNDVWAIRIYVNTLNKMGKWCFYSTHRPYDD